MDDGGLWDRVVWVDAQVRGSMHPATYMCRALADNGLREPPQSTPWERAYWRRDGHDDARMDRELEDVFTLWDEQIRPWFHRDEEAERVGLFVSWPPLKDCPEIDAESATVGDWVTAHQQAGWWAAERRSTGSTYSDAHARRQERRWAQVRDAARPVANSLIRRVADALETHMDSTRVRLHTNTRRPSAWV